MLWYLESVRDVDGDAYSLAARSSEHPWLSPGTACHSLCSSSPVGELPPGDQGMAATVVKSKYMVDPENSLNLIR